eukprot:scaffold1806_cov240-Pinguiococcus_pyrenoidosus.AAC.9
MPCAEEDLQSSVAGRKPQKPLRKHPGNEGLPSHNNPSANIRWTHDIREARRFKKRFYSGVLGRCRIRGGNCLRWPPLNEEFFSAQGGSACTRLCAALTEHTHLLHLSRERDPASLSVCRNDGDLTWRSLSTAAFRSAGGLKPWQR